MLHLEHKPAVSEAMQIRPGAVSAVVHVATLLLFGGILHRAPKIAPYNLPGTKRGTTLLTYYAAGSRERPATAIASKVADTPKLISPLPSTLAEPAAPAASAPAEEPGAGHAAESGLGDGEINMAQLTHFPHPKPDLSSLPHGTQGDVVLNAVIDEHGRIASLTLLKGLGEPIDNQVIAAVREWTYIPATKNGTPVSSEQELHFHYERG